MPDPKINLADLRERAEPRTRITLRSSEVLALIGAVQAAHAVYGLMVEDCIEHSDIDRLRDTLIRFNFENA